MKALLRCFLIVLVALSPTGCSDENHTRNIPKTPVTPETPAPTVVFDTGRGTGQYDVMTYFKYTSGLVLIPQEDMTVTAIRPQVYFCNGTSGFLAFIRDSLYQPLAAEAGLAEGTGFSNPTFSDRHLDSPVTLKAGTKYYIVMDVWTTKSIGIYTTGSRGEGVVGAATYWTWWANSDTADHLDRGAIAFELVAQP